MNLANAASTALQVVVRQCQRELGELLRHAGRAGYAKRGHARAGLHQQRVGVAVVAAVELHDDLAPGSGARQPDGRHRRLGAGADEAHLLDGGKRLGHQRGQIGFGRSGRAEARAVARGLDDGLDDLRIGVAQNQRAPGADVVDVAIAVGVPDVRALAADEERRVAADRTEGADRRIHSAGNELLSSLLQRAGLLQDCGPWFLTIETQESIRRAHREV